MIQPAPGIVAAQDVVGKHLMLQDCQSLSDFSSCFPSLGTDTWTWLGCPGSTAPQGRALALIRWLWLDITSSGQLWGTPVLGEPTQQVASFLMGRTGGPGTCMVTRSPSPPWQETSLPFAQLTPKQPPAPLPPYRGKSPSTSLPRRDSLPHPQLPEGPRWGGEQWRGDSGHLLPVGSCKTPADEQPLCPLQPGSVRCPPGTLHASACGASTRL